MSASQHKEGDFVQKHASSEGRTLTFHEAINRMIGDVESGELEARPGVQKAVRDVAKTYSMDEDEVVKELQTQVAIRTASMRERATHLTECTRGLTK